jgi:hypothetical protein
MDDLRSYIRLILETSNKEFLDEFRPLYDEWADYQTSLGPINAPFYDDPEGERHFLDQQMISPDELPSWATQEKSSKHYDYLTRHPSSRRVSYTQTENEEDIDKKLLRLFRKYADQSFFKNEVTLVHSFSYPIAFEALPPRMDTGLKFSENDRVKYLQDEGSRFRDVISARGSTNGTIPGGGYGMIIDGHVVFASTGDLGSQVTRMAHADVKEKYKNSGLPKRTSPGTVGSSPASVDKRLERNKMRSATAERRGRKLMGTHPTNREELEAQMNGVVLNSEDATKTMEEVLVANWTTKAWFFTPDENNMPDPYHFWKKAYEVGIKGPIYAIDGYGKKQQVNLSDYFEKEIEADEPGEF